MVKNEGYIIYCRVSGRERLRDEQARKLRRSEVMSSNTTHRRVGITKSKRKPYLRKYQENIN